MGEFVYFGWGEDVEEGRHVPGDTCVIVDVVCFGVLFVGL